MNKYFLCFLFICLSPKFVLSQTVVERNIKMGNETATVRAWIPHTTERDTITNVLYVFDADYCFDIVVSHVNYLFNMCRTIPPVCVVGVYYPGQRGRACVGLNQDNMTLNSTGESFLHYIQDDVFPAVQDIIKCSSCYNIFFGHSYLADYGCFLMKNKSEMFDSYLLLAPESGRVPIFEKSDVADKRIYIAIGNQDAKRRVKFSRHLSTAVKRVADNTNVKMQIFNTATHMSIIPVALTSGINYLYKDLVNKDNMSEFINRKKSIVENYETLCSFNAFYHCKLRNDARTILDLLELSKPCSVEEFETVLEHLPATNGNHHEIIAFEYLNLKCYDKAEAYFNKAIDLYIKEGARNFMNNAYDGLIQLYVEKKEPSSNVDHIYEKAMSSMPGDFDLYFKRGRFNIESEFNNEKGITFLQKYLSNYNESYRLYPLCDVFYYIALGYFRLGAFQEAQSWIDKSLEKNAGYKKSKLLKNEIYSKIR